MTSLLAFTLLLSVAQIFAQEPFVPSSGPGSLVGSILGGRTNENPGPERWIEFMDMDNDWSRLGSCFTVEAWVRHNSQGLADWQPIVGRHPGMNTPREYAHFYMAINNGNIEAKVGCGCENGTECGYGYSLQASFASDTWEHVALVVDGDDTSADSTSRIANLYIGGVLASTSSWAQDDTQCAGRSVQFSKYAPVTVGFMDDESENPLNTANLNDVRGWWGQIEELRFWQGLRSLSQIEDFHDLGLKGSETGLFGYYPFSPDQETLQDPETPKQIKNEAGNKMYGLPQPDPTDPAIYAQDISLSNRIYSYVTVLGRNSLVGDLPLLPNNIKYDFWPEVEDVSVETEEIEGALATLGTDFLLQANPEDSTEATVFVNCTGNCDQYTDNFRDFFFDYVATFENPALSTRMYLRIETACPSAVYDDCGVCDGDNSECQCVVYHGFDADRMAYILFDWSITNLMQEISDAVDTLTQTQTILEMTEVENPEMRQQIQDVMMFYNMDLTEYCSDFNTFKTELEGAVPRAPESLIDQAASADSDGSIPYIPSFVPNF